VHVVVAHECLDASEHVLLGVAEAGGDLSLQVEGQGVDGALVDEMHLGAYAQEEVVGLLQQAAFALGEYLFLDELAGGDGARVEVSVPQQILVVAESAGAVFDVRFLHRDDAPVLLVQFLLVDQTPGDVGVLFALHAFAFESLAEFRDQLAVAGQPA
jgi:hypothetical protein